jgi:hypothetical protein
VRAGLLLLRAGPLLVRADVLAERGLALRPPSLRLWLRA